MAQPILAEIVGTRMAETGAGGYYTNSTSYSMLVYYSDGKIELIEGDSSRIRPYLHLIQPRFTSLSLEPVKNNILESMASENNKLKNEIAKLHDEFDKMHSNFKTTQSILKDIAALLQPIPDIIGKSRHEAIHILNSNNLIYQEDDQINERITGTVIQALRDRDKYNVIHVKVKYDLPDVIGLDVDDAKRVLKNAGFFYSIKLVNCNDGSSSNKVLNTVYTNGGKVELEVALSERDRFLEDLDNATSIIQVQQSWIHHRFAETHPQTNAVIEQHANTEKQYGKSLNIGIIKLEIRHSFEEEN